jgi:TRAP-type C4-dicarboxylate transport system substrate-binding protein
MTSASRRRFLMALPAAPLLWRLGPARAAAQNLRVGTLAPRGSAYEQVLLEVGQAWRNAEGPGARFTVFAGGSQGDEADLVRRMRIGQLSGAMMSVIGLVEIDRDAAALQYMPMMFRSWQEVDAAGRRVRPLIEKRMAERGFIVLYWAEAGWVRFFSKRPASRPEDFKRLKMFAWAGSPEQVELMKQMGYRPVVLETADILPGLQTGLIDAAPLTATWALATQIDSLAPYMLDLRWVPIVGATLVTRAAWEAMSPAGREAMRAASAKASAELRAVRARDDEEAVRAMQRRGLHVESLTPEAAAEWQRLAESAYPRMRGTMVPADMFDAAQQAVAEYRQKRAGQ